jgi:hypothetical protein
MIQNKKTKLELTWLGKENPPRLEPRILLETPEQSYHVPRCVRLEKGGESFRKCSGNCGTKSPPGFVLIELHSAL